MRAIPAKHAFRLLLALYLFDLWAMSAFYPAHPAARWVLPALIVLVLGLSAWADRSYLAPPPERSPGAPAPPLAPRDVEPIRTPPPPANRVADAAAFVAWPVSLDREPPTRCYLERLLLVEPDPALREKLALAVIERGYDVVAVETAEEARALVRQNRRARQIPYSLAALGTSSVHATAADLGRDLRQLDPELGLILMVDARAGEAELTAVGRHPEPLVDDALLKPVAPEDFVRSVQHSLNRRFERAFAAAA
jgi:CheY-like chemotaxis protein